jgi:S-DNA-T family DNA segregation ATPase FtsK/SpoIIIE
MLTIQKTLEHFRIHVDMGEVTVGPTVTQFTLKPAQGVNLSKISALHDNLAMELGSEFLRIEAPIPGKTLVGIEVPNERKATLGLRSLLELEEFNQGGPLTLAIGKSIVGKPIFADLEKMPHSPKPPYLSIVQKFSF